MLELSTMCQINKGLAINAGISRKIYVIENTMVSLSPVAWVREKKKG